MLSVFVENFGAAFQDNVSCTSFLADSQASTGELDVMRPDLAYFWGLNTFQEPSSGSFLVIILSSTPEHSSTLLL